MTATFTRAQKIIVGKYLSSAGAFNTEEQFFKTLAQLTEAKNSMAKENAQEKYREAEAYRERALALQTQCRTRTNEYLQSFWIQNPLRRFGYAPDSDIQLIKDYLFYLRYNYLRETTFLYFTAITTMTGPDETPDLELVQNAIMNVRLLLDMRHDQKAKFLSESLEAKLIEEFLRLVTLDRVETITVDSKHKRWVQTFNTKLKGRFYSDEDIERYKERLRQIEKQPTVRVQRLNAQAGKDLTERRYDEAKAKFQEAYIITEQHPASFTNQTSTARLATSYSLTLACYEQVRSIELKASTKENKLQQLDELWVWTQNTQRDIENYVRKAHAEGLSSKEIYQTAEDFTHALSLIYSQLAEIANEYIAIVVFLEEKTAQTQQVHTKNELRIEAIGLLQTALERYNATTAFLQRYAEYPSDLIICTQLMLSHPDRKKEIKGKLNAIQQELEQDKLREEELAQKLAEAELAAKKAEEELTRELQEDEQRQAQELEKRTPKFTAANCQVVDHEGKVEKEGVKKEGPTSTAEKDKDEAEEEPAINLASKAIQQYVVEKTPEALQTAKVACTTAIDIAKAEHNWLAEAEASYQHAHLHMMVVLRTYPPTDESVKEHRLAQSLLCDAYRASRRIEDITNQEHAQTIITMLQETNNTFLVAQLDKVQRAQAKLEELEASRQEAIERFGGIEAWRDNPRVKERGASKEARAYKQHKLQFKPCADLEGKYVTMQRQSDEFNDEFLGQRPFVALVPHRQTTGQQEHTPHLLEALS